VVEERTNSGSPKTGARFKEWDAREAFLNGEIRPDEKHGVATEDWDPERQLRKGNTIKGSGVTIGDYDPE